MYEHWSEIAHKEIVLIQKFLLVCEVKRKHVIIDVNFYIEKIYFEFIVDLSIKSRRNDIQYFWAIIIF